MGRLRPGPLRILEVVTDLGHVAGKFTRAREIEIRPQGGLVISGRTYTPDDLLRHLESLITGVERVLDSRRPENDPHALCSVADRNRREIARRINSLQTEIRDNGYSTAAATAVLLSLRCRLSDWFKPYDRLGISSSEIRRPVPLNEELLVKDNHILSSTLVETSDK